MYLREVIEFLEQRDPETKVPVGFGNPHSYRGSYDQLAFEPVALTTVGRMLGIAKQALGSTYEGYKGGEYAMSEWTPCNLARWGETGEEIGLLLLQYMVGDVRHNAGIHRPRSGPVE